MPLRQGKGQLQKQKDDKAKLPERIDVTGLAG